MTNQQPSEYPPIDIVVALFDRLTALDAVGPYEVLQRLPGATVTFAGDRRGEYRTDHGFLGLMSDATFSEHPHPDVIVVPGGVGTRDIIEDSPIVDWLRGAHQTSRFTTSVCTGSLILGVAGLLDGLSATTHWSAYDLLEKHGAIPTNERVVEHLDERIVTGAGVSAGIDMALRLSEILVDDVAAKAMQLGIEYDPQPPFDTGALHKADDEVVSRLIAYTEAMK